MTTTAQADLKATLEASLYLEQTEKLLKDTIASRANDDLLRAVEAVNSNAFDLLTAAKQEVVLGLYMKALVACGVVLP